jgi:hypothetical protein
MSHMVFFSYEPAFLAEKAGIPFRVEFDDMPLKPSRGDESYG